ncbi:hypothetical protein SEA_GREEDYLAWYER_41 [Mycobacterium phage GreedyLawyer]|uniref:Uncharacterized protein n=2 Tax=Gladiatorvirus ericB TaxID=1041406 RepID=G1EBR3_9CAUD|nr:hypothetical protein AXJ19_gp071 [Mycobacterium phage VohminGhazi]YP_009637845.1 hypothetical protein FGG32_gp068 [Mycobacterium phage EricB]AEK08484.1 hypothetical protein PBI_DAVINCI_41 [Mycobacterium phage DaVinci]AMQ66875.1 hypothetical protein PBI_MCFLY_41 [Mycobacterium phage McFly]AVR76901.1 hypothetical protein SEA_GREEDYLAWYER_41 [Mycobacterium phage GreedyLawyer]QXO14794.1 hypothetical protein SEA_SMELLYB_41 [Mycobacterium phage SmellyB]QYW01246.1 hypothetical protein SEA_HOOT_41
MIDTDEQDHQFFDILYQQWSKSTWAEHSYWMPEEDQSFPGCFNIIAVDQSKEEKNRNPIAAFLKEEDAEFIAGLHGAVPDLIRRLHEAIDDATRKDEENDRAQGMLADALLENQGLKEQIRELEAQIG